MIILHKGDVENGTINGGFRGKDERMHPNQHITIFAREKYRQSLPYKIQLEASFTQNAQSVWRPVAAAAGAYSAPQIT